MVQKNSIEATMEIMLLEKNTFNYVVVLLDNASSDFDDRGGVVKMHVLHSTTNNIECREQAVVDARLFFLARSSLPPSLLLTKKKVPMVSHHRPPPSPHLLPECPSDRLSLPPFLLLHFTIAQMLDVGTTGEYLTPLTQKGGDSCPTDSSSSSHTCFEICVPTLLKIQPHLILCSLIFFCKCCDYLRSFSEKRNNFGLRSPDRRRENGEIPFLPFATIRNYPGKRSVFVH